MNKVRVWSLFFCSTSFGAIASANTYTLDAPPLGLPGAIQNTINAAGPGDTILLNPGTYPESINFMNRAITIKSSPLGSASNTIIDPGLTAGSPHLPVVSFDHGETSASVLQDLTIRGGSGDGLTGFEGGGIRIVNNSSPTIDGCIILSNGAMFNTPKGGGIYIKGGAPIIKHCTIQGNSAAAHGGGIYCEDSQAIIQDNGGTNGGVLQLGAISGNTAGSGGGGIYVTGNSAVTILNNRIGANTVNSGSGGGVAIEGTSTTASLAFNLITDNTVSPFPPTQGGGGIACLTTAAGAIQILSNQITANTSGNDGGGIHCYKSSPLISLNTITDNFADRYGGGINLYDQSSPQVASTTIAGNYAYDSGGGMSIQEKSNAAVRGCDISGNFPRLLGGGIYIADSSPIIGSSSLRGNGTYHPLHGFTQYGGGIAIRAATLAAATAPAIVGCTIGSNFAVVNGGGIFMDAGTATISRNTITGNGVAADQAGALTFTRSGGGIWAGQCSPIIDANSVIANQVGPNGLGVGAGVSLNNLPSDAPAFTNNIVVQNWARQGMGGGVNTVGLGGYQFINNTIADNYNGATLGVPSLTDQGNALYNSGSTLDIWNCIVRGDVNWVPIKDVAGGMTNINTVSLPLVCNNIGPVLPPGWPASAGLNPQFVNPAAGNYRLLLGSPCIDAGSSTPLGGLSLKDFENQNRPNPTPPGLPDIGADEYY